MKKLESLEKYLQQQALMAQKQGDAQRKRDSALEALQAAKAEYSALVRRSVTEGVNLDAEIDKADEAVQKAERTYRRYEEEYNVSVAVHRVKDQKDAIVTDWNNDYYPNVIMAELINPRLEELLAAGNAYADAFEKTLAAITEAKALREDAKSALGRGYEYKLREVDTLSVNNPITASALTVEDLRELAQGTRPKKFKKEAK